MQEQSEHSANGAVVVTGGGSGIGRTIAERFAQAGEAVLIFDHNEAAAEQVTADLKAAGHRAVAFVGSVSNEDDVSAAFELAEASFDGVKTLINNAGISGNCPTIELSLGEWQRNIDVNLTGVFLCSREAGRRLIKSGKPGVIINMASMYGVVAAPNRISYCSTKSGVVMMTKTLALEWASAGIRVNGIAPGYVHTDLTHELIKTGRLDAEALNRRTPLGRFGTPEEVADLAWFLASDQSRFITGQVVGVDGGWSANGYL
ncbi:3-oxoacyl-ACP reductase FabG [Vreelandella maris]|mgnify:FL=1|uniref:SDR family oxidoreductase n=1 Tax=Vreelandella maris TaxID=2729617 RepID=A0A7Y6VAF9_9GAMM|nr:SDR family oxidoreductase [Halomonas maris]